MFNTGNVIYNVWLAYFDTSLPSKVSYRRIMFYLDILYSCDDEHPIYKTMKNQISVDIVRH